MHTKTAKMRRVVFFANFLFALSGSVAIYTNSSFMEKTVGVEIVSLLYAISSIVSMFFLARAGKFLKRAGNRMFFAFYGALYALSIVWLIVPAPAVFTIVAFVVYLFSTNMLLYSLNVFFEHLTAPKGRGNMRGSFLLLMNTGIMLGPLIAAFAIARAGFGGIYAFSLAIFAIVAIVMHTGLRPYHDAEYSAHHTHIALRHTLKSKTLRSVIAANFILQFFYAWMVVYTPIYLFEYVHLSWNTIGIIFTLMLTTFVVLDYPLGRLADWLGTEKEFTAIGFLIMALSVFGIAFLQVPSVFIIGALLFFSRIGAATVEAMTEIHFYKVAKESDPGLLSLFCDLRPLSFIIAPLLGALALTVLPFNSIFIILGTVLLLGMFISLSMEKKDGWWIPAHKN